MQKRGVEFSEFLRQSLLAFHAHGFKPLSTIPLDELEIWLHLEVVETYYSWYFDIQEN